MYFWCAEKESRVPCQLTFRMWSKTHWNLDFPYHPWDFYVDYCSVANPVNPSSAIPSERGYPYSQICIWQFCNELIDFRNVHTFLLCYKPFRILTLFSHFSWLSHKKKKKKEATEWPARFTRKCLGLPGLLKTSFFAFIFSSWGESKVDWMYCEIFFLRWVWKFEREGCCCSLVWYSPGWHSSCHGDEMKL